MPDHPPSTDARASLAQPSQSSSPLECTSHLGFSLGQVGPDRRDVWDGFERTDTVTAYPMVENHDTEQRKVWWPGRTRTLLLWSLLDPAAASNPLSSCGQGQAVYSFPKDYG